MHPLTFLTIPESVYRMMASDSGIPNRKLTSYYRERMNELGYETTIFVTSLTGQRPLHPHRELSRMDGSYTRSVLDLVESIRPRLSEPFRTLATEDLAVDGIFLVRKKQGD